MDNNIETIILGGGCFWCVDAIFKQTKGVLNTETGYSNGDISNPNYKIVACGTTNYAEVVKITYYKNLISLKELLKLFFKIHNPTTLNRQGLDIGTQYRSIIVYFKQEQKREIIKFIDDLDSSKVYRNKIVTQVEKLTSYYKAEEEHQDYFTKNPNNGYCQVFIEPKLKILKDKYSDLIK